MQTHAHKASDKQSSSIASRSVDKKSSEHSVFEFEDNRHETNARGELQVMANGSSQVKQLNTLGQMAENSPQAEKIAQLQTIADNGQQMVSGTEQLQAKPEEEKPLQGKFEAAQRQSAKEDELVQGQFAASSDSTQLQGDSGAAENRTGLPNDLKSGIENMSGISLDGVKVHYNSSKPAQMQALAYTQGTDIHVGPGQEKHLGHEAWHVVQQHQGRVRPTTQMGGTQVNDDAGLEGEADVMGERANQTGSFSLQKKAQSKPDSIRHNSRQTQLTSIVQMSNASVVQMRLGALKYAAFVSSGTIMTHPVIANFAANQANTWGEANAIYEIGVLLPNNLNLIPALRLGTNNDNVLLKRLIQLSGGDANAAQLNNMLGTVTAANAHLLETILPAAGGAANLAQLVPLITTVGAADAHNLVQLIPLSGGAANLAALDNLITAAGVAYTNILPQMIRDSGGAGQIANLTNIINRHPGQANVAVDLTRVARGDAATFGRLAAEVPTFNQTPPAPAGGTAAALANYNALAAGGVGQPHIAPLPGGIRVNHFLTRHTAEFFNFGEIKDENTLWPVAWGGATVGNVEGRVSIALNTLSAAGNWLTPGNPLLVPIGGGVTAQIATRGPAAGPQIVGMFFPMNNPGAQVYDHPDDQMKAIQKVL